MTDTPKCARTACQRSLDRGYYEIYNEPSTGQPRLYCLSCGRKITEFNAQDVTLGRSEIKLEYRKHYPPIPLTRIKP